MPITKVRSGYFDLYIVVDLVRKKATRDPITEPSCDMGRLMAP
jgi:hypothetical protein